MDVSFDRAALPILPHRAYRRPRPIGRAALLASIALVAAAEALVAVFRGDLADLFTRVATALLPAGERAPGRPFMGVAIRPLVIDLQPLDYRALLVWFLASVACIALLAKARRVRVPLRYMGVYNLLLATASAAWILFAGRLGYGAETFSELYLRTAIVIWLVIPVFVGGISLFLPFNLRERALVVLATFAYNVAFSAVRYALFALLLSWTGAVALPALFLFFGPLLDFVYVVGVFSVFLVPLSRRLGHEGPQDVWTWL